MKRVEIDGKFFRERRGKLVEIPAEWVGQTLHEQTKRKRPSKKTNKHRRQDASRNFSGGGWKNIEYIDGREAMVDEEA